MEHHLFAVCVSWQMELCISLFYQRWLKTAFLQFVHINCSHMLMFCFLCFFLRKYWSRLWKGLSVYRRILCDYYHCWFVFNLTKRMGFCGTIFSSSDSLFTSTIVWHPDSIGEPFKFEVYLMFQGIPKLFSGNQNIYLKHALFKRREKKNNKINK